MCVGGRVIEIKPVPERPGLLRLWVMDPRTFDEVCVHVEEAIEMPGLGDAVWWQSGKVFFAEDRCFLTKVGFSFRPPLEEMRVG